MKILVVEDDPISLKIISTHLIRAGHEVYQAANGKIAWEMLQDEEHPRMVITDWMMPHMDGLTLCRLIREREKEMVTPNVYTYIIILTSNDERDNLIKGLEAGADDYIAKPVVSQELILRIKAGERILNLHEKLMELNTKLREAAIIDPLMEIGNRRSFYEMIAKFHKYALRHDKGYGLVICDVDFFKRYNDTYGHPAGDEVLRTIAKIIKHSLRSTDEIFRYGGEEIVLLLPEQNIYGAMMVAEKVRNRIYRAAIEHRASDFGVVTISCGASAFMRCAKEWQDILDCADKALYEAKRAGRNCVKALSLQTFLMDKNRPNNITL